MQKIVAILFSLMVAQLSAQEKVTAGLEPAGYKLEFTEEVRFGSVEDDDEYHWPSLRTRILPAADGGMYVFDHDGSRVLLFDGSGAFVKQVARKGNGPGEIRYMTAVSQSAAGNIYIMDSPGPGNPTTIKRFNADMSFRGEISTAEMGIRPEALYVSPDEKHMTGLFVTFDHETKGLVNKTGVLRLKDHKLVNQFHVEATEFFGGGDKTQGEWADMIAAGILQKNRAGLTAVGSDGTIYTAAVDKNLVSQWAPGGKKPVRMVDSKHKPELFTKEDQAALIEYQYSNLSPPARKMISRATLKAGFEKADVTVHPAMVAIIPIEDQGYLVVRSADVDTRENRGDVYSKAGVFLARVVLPDAALCVAIPGRWTPMTRMVFHQGKAYTILTNEDDENIAVRYRYELKKS